MSNSQSRDFKFCKLCGTMLCLISAKCAECPLCKNRTSAKAILGKEISYTLTAERKKDFTTFPSDIEMLQVSLEMEYMRKQDIRRDLGITRVNEEIPTKRTEQRIQQTCSKCKHEWQTYTYRQIRSADEGQSVFYTCEKCGEQTRED